MRRRLPQAWSRLGLSAKFGVIYALVLLLILLAFLGCYASLRMVKSAEQTMLVSMEIRQEVFALDGQMEKARRLYRDFLLGYPQIGYAKAYERFAHPAIVAMARLNAINERLRALLGQPNASTGLDRRKVDIRVYLSTVKRFTGIALTQYDLFKSLVHPEGGLEPQLDAVIAALKAAVGASGKGSILLREALLLEKEYRLTRNRPIMQASLNLMGQLRTDVIEAGEVAGPLGEVVLPLLDRYARLSQRILDIDVAIRSNANDFVLQAKAMDPIGADLMAVSSAEVEAAQRRIGFSSGLAGGIILVSALVCLGGALCIARLIHGSVTSRLVELTRRAARLRAVEPGDAAPPVSGDELTVLDETFIAMTRRVEDLVGNLEANVRQRTMELDAINRELDRKNQALEVLSMTDRLTGLCNRRKLDQALEAEIRRTRRYNTPFSVVMLDLDHFKAVNDRFGHQRGDAVLVRAADYLLSLVRDTDIVGRWGGEEFLVVCPETPLPVAIRLAERLRREIGQIAHPVVGGITASCGVAQHRLDEGVAELISAVDAALYRAKRQGRNQVVPPLLHRLA